MKIYFITCFALLSLGSPATAFDILPKKVPGAENNPAKISLGRQLYFDKRLSGNDSVSCNSCHNVMTSGTDNLPTSTGIHGQKGGRNSPTVFNSAFMSVQFWDGRANTLEDQAKGPLTNPIEMGMESHTVVVEKLKKIPGYVTQFEKIYKSKDFSIDHVADAIAMYERTLITPNSPVDKYVKGDKKALSASAIRGKNLVQEVGCMACHMGPNYAGPALPVGTGFYQKFPVIEDAEIEKKYGFKKDLGRFDVTKAEGDKNMYRVPTWRNVALTAPYFHNGAVATLDEAVRIMAKTQLNRDLTPVQISDIVAFLNGLTGQLPKEKEPTLPQ